MQDLLLYLLFLTVNQGVDEIALYCVYLMLQQVEDCDIFMHVFRIELASLLQVAMKLA